MYSINGYPCQSMRIHRHQQVVHAKPMDIQRSLQYPGVSTESMSIIDIGESLVSQWIKWICSPLGPMRLYLTRVIIKYSSPEYHPFFRRWRSHTTHRECFCQSGNGFYDVCSTQWRDFRAMERLHLELPNARAKRRMLGSSTDTDTPVRVYVR